MTIITVAILVAAAAFAIWILYTVIWRAVRRGLHEFEIGHSGASVLTLPTGIRVSHGSSTDVVPDYPPREWV